MKNFVRNGAFELSLLAPGLGDCYVNEELIVLQCVLMADVVKKLTNTPEPFRIGTGDDSHQLYRINKVGIWSKINHKHEEYVQCHI